MRSSVQLAADRKGVRWVVEERGDCGVLGKAEEVVRAKFVIL